MNTANKEVKFDDDPFKLEGLNDGLNILLLAARASAMLAMAALSLWLLFELTGNVGEFIKAEVGALSSVATFLAGGAIALASVGLIGACILSALYLTLVSYVWVKKIVREWKWVWKRIKSGGILGTIIGVLALVLTLVESIFWVLVTVITIITVWVNVVAVTAAMG